MKFGADHGAVRVRRVQGNLGDDSGIEFSAGDLTPAATTEDERINSSHSSPFQPPLVPDLRPSGSSPILDVNFDEFLHSDGDAEDCLQDDWSFVSSSSSDESLLSSFVTWMATLRGRQHYVDGNITRTRATRKQDEDTRTSATKHKENVLNDARCGVVNGRRRARVTAVILRAVSLSTKRLLLAELF